MVDLDSPVLLLIGDEAYQKEKTIEDLRSSLLADSSQDLDYKIFYGAEATAREILDYATTFPFTAAKKLVVIKNYEKLPEEEKTRLIAYIKKPSKFTCLVLDALDKSALDDLHPVAHFIKVLRYTALSDPELSSWITRSLSSKGKKIEDGAMDLLKELQGANLLSLTQELDKLAAFVGDRDVIKLGDVEGLTGRSTEQAVFDIAWAIGGKKTDEALRIATELIMRGKKVHEIVGILCWHLRRLLGAKLLQAKGERDYSIGRMLGIRSQNLNYFFKQLRYYDADQIKSKLKVLLDADLDIKRTKFDPALVLEFAIIRLCLG